MGRPRVLFAMASISLAGLLWTVPIADHAPAVAGKAASTTTTGVPGGSYPIPPCPKWALGNAELPSPRSQAFMEFDPPIGQMVLYGGLSDSCLSTTALYDNLTATWFWNGHRWHSAHPQGSPSVPATEGGLVYDSRLDALVMVAQLNGPDLETLSFNGTRWQRLHVDVDPPAGIIFLSYDEVTGDIVLLSEDSTSTVWDFDGKDWVQGPPMPAEFSPAAMSYDPALSSVIVVGSSTTGNFDALILAGRTWAPLHTEGVSPTLRQTDINLAMAFDQRFRELVLYYGDLTPPLISQTWVLRAKTWLSVRAPTNLVARKLPSLASWDSRGDVALFGGEGVTSFYNDLWNFTGDGWERLSDAADSA